MASVKRILLGSLVAAGLLLIPVAAAPFALAGNPCYHEFVVPDVTAAAATEIQLQPCAFEPTISVVQAGETVTFRNSTADTHLVTGANAEWGDRDIQVGAHQSIAYTFDEPGVYPYACTIHPGMSGAIVVGDGGEPLAAAFAAATAGGGGGSNSQGGAGTGSAATTPTAIASTPTIDPLVVAAVAGLAGAALALLVVAVVARSRGTARTTAGDAEAAATPTAEPLTR